MSAIYLSGMFACPLGAVTGAEPLLQNLWTGDGVPLAESSLLLLGVGSLGLSSSSDFLHSSLHFLELLSSLLALDGSELVSEEEGLGVVLLSSVGIIVDASKSGGSATTELGVESENGDVLWLGVEHLSELLLDGGLGDGSLIRVDQLNNDLLSLHERVLDESSGVADNVFLFVGHA